MRLSSGSPWYLECDIEQIGNDYLCRIQGGDRHIGAVALSQWSSGRAATKCLAASGHKEEVIAVEAAHTLCAATRRRVSCLAGVHYDSLSRFEIDEIVETARGLIRQAARQLENHRFEEALGAPECPLSRIESAAAEFSRAVDDFLDRPLDEATASAAARVAVAESFGNQVCLFAPLYLCSGCSNECVYCGFRRSARFERKRLSIGQAVEEARQLTKVGHRTIDLVTGEIATDRFVDYVCQATYAILDSTGIRRVNLNLGALSSEQFHRLRSSGASGYHLYQETYAPSSYFEVHERGLKRDMAYRLEGPHRAARAGFQSIGLGILLGLHPLREDLAALAGHARLLMQDFPRLRIGFSLPRLQDVETGREYTAASTVGDDEFVKAMLFLRLQFPSAHLTVTTRERPAIRDRLLSLGVTKVSAGVSTAPGGYTLDRPGASQFDISDRRPPSVIKEVIERSGMAVTYV